MIDQCARFREDILAESATLAALLETYVGRDSPLEGRSFDPERVVFIGMGSSRFAALPAAAFLRKPRDRRRR
jgi:fructoselysine-6-P-deglycase FrlB-like protein